MSRGEILKKEFDEAIEKYVLYLKSRRKKIEANINARSVVRPFKLFIKNESSIDDDILGNINRYIMKGYVLRKDEQLIKKVACGNIKQRDFVIQAFKEVLNYNIGDDRTIYSFLGDAKYMQNTGNDLRNTRDTNAQKIKDIDFFIYVIERSRKVVEERSKELHTKQLAEIKRAKISAYEKKAAKERKKRQLEEKERMRIKELVNKNSNVIYKNDVLLPNSKGETKRKTIAETENIDEYDTTRVHDILKKLPDSVNNIGLLIPRSISMQMILPSRIQENNQVWESMKDQMDDYYNIPDKLLKKANAFSYLKFPVRKLMSHFFLEYTNVTKTNENVFYRILSKSLYLPIFSKKKERWTIFKMNKMDPDKYSLIFLVINISQLLDRSIQLI
jgi:hypothetical protein